MHRCLYLPTFLLLGCIAIMLMCYRWYYLCPLVILQITQSSSRAKSLCQKLRKPCKATAKAPANLIPASITSKARKRKFNPTDACVASEQQHRKKAANPLNKGQSRCVMVVVLKEVPTTIPKGPLRGRLRKVGRIRELCLFRTMTKEDVHRVIERSFESLGLKRYLFLQGHRDNTLTVFEKQSLDGTAELAGCGSLYLQEQSSTPPPSCNDSSPRSSTSSDSHPDEMECTMTIPNPVSETSNTL